jgi:hypothetical protein
MELAFIQRLPRGNFVTSFQGFFMKNRIALCLLSALILGGCANTQFNVGGQVGPTATPRYEERQTYFVSGLGQRQTIDAARICGGADKVAAVGKEMTFIDGLLGALTAGIYTPETARVYCK